MDQICLVYYNNKNNMFAEKDFIVLPLRISPFVTEPFFLICFIAFY